MYTQFLVCNYGPAGNVIGHPVYIPRRAARQTFKTNYEGGEYRKTGIDDTENDNDSESEFDFKDAEYNNGHAITINNVYIADNDFGGSFAEVDDENFQDQDPEM